MNSTVNDLDSLKENMDHFFLLVNAIIVFLIQCGFAFLEAGSVKAKNTTNILLKNMLDAFLGAVAYWAFGYAFAFGDPGNGFIGHNYFFFGNMPDNLLSNFFFHFVFAAAAATIVSGAMAERTDFKAYMIYSVFITGFVYPVVTHWAWDPNGWLYKGIVVRGEPISYQDFAGSSVVHMVGGIAALVGAAILGPRKGRFDDDNADFSGHTVPLVALGGFILFFGFFAFNGGSLAAISNPGDGEIVANSIVNTIMSGSASALVALVLVKFFFWKKKWSLLTTINGGLTGMIAICAGCNSVYAWGAFVTGLVAGFVYIGSSALMVKLKIDDPLDAVAVHLGGGLWGVLSVPFLARNTGIFFRWNALSFAQLGWNIVGTCVISAWTTALSILLFGSLQLLHILRVDPDTEEKGLDVKEHGEPAYPLMAYVGQDGKYGLPNGVGMELAHVEKVNEGFVKETAADVKMANKKEASQVL